MAEFEFKFKFKSQVANGFWVFNDRAKASTMLEDGSFGEPKMSISLSSEGVKGIGIEISSSSGREQSWDDGVLGVFVGRSGSLSILGFVSPENQFRFQDINGFLVAYGGFPMWV